MRRVPAEQCNAVDESLGQVAFLFVACDAHLYAESLRKFLALCVEQQGQVSELRTLQLEHVVEDQVLRSRWQPFFAADNMADVHREVVHDVGKVVRWEAIVFQDNLVIYIFVVEDDLPMNDVLERCLALRHLHSDDEGLAVRFLLFDLLFREVVQAEAVVLGLGVLLTTDLDSHFLKSLRCAEARVGIAVLDKRVDVLVVDVQALALVIGAVGTLGLTVLLIAFVSLLVEGARSLVPGHAGPLEHFNDVFDATFHFAILKQI